MQRIKYILSIGLVILLSACSALAPPRQIAPVTGQVIDEATAQPVEGATVVMRWQGTGTKAFVDQHTECYHVETATSDSEGRFSSKPWQEESRYRNLGLKERMVTVYKVGYRHVRSEGEAHYLERDTGSVEERLAYLKNLVRNSGCFGAGKLRRRLYSVLEAVFYEARQLEAPHDMLQWLREVAASAWLAHDGAVSSRVHNREISKFLRDHLL